MKRLLIGLWALVSAVAVSAQAPVPPDIAARNFLLIDMSSRQVLTERNADLPADPASLTKLMTAWLVFEALQNNKLTLTQRLPVSQRAFAERKGGGSLMFLDPKMTPTVDELLRGMIVASGNDASIVLAEGTAGSVGEFVARMNRQAEAWGLRNTQFKNPTGLTEPGHRSTARELAVIAERVLRDFPTQYATYYRLRDYTFNNIKQDNRNLLLARDPSVDGMKTGFTEAAGYCLIASAQRDLPNGQRRLLSVVMGAASREVRAAETQKLLNWGYTAWDAVRLFEPGKAVVEVPVWKGQVNTVKLGSPEAIFVSVPRGEGQRLKPTIQRTEPLLAPLAKGQRVGTLEVANGSGTRLASIPLVVLDTVEPAGWLGRSWDTLRLWIK